MAPSRIQIPPDILERARALYENGTPLDELGVLMGVSGQTVRNRAIELGWSRTRPTRPAAPDEKWPDTPPPMREPAPEDAEPDALVARLGRMAAREMLRAETYNHSPEAAARTLAMLAKTVSTLRAMHTGRPELHGDDATAQYRLDIAHRLDQLRRERENREYEGLADDPPFTW